MRTKVEVQEELIDVLSSQVLQLSAMSKIELGDDVIQKIKHLKEELDGCDTIARLKEEYVINEEDIEHVLGKHKHGKLSLINYEGDCLRAEYGKNGKVAVYDQYDYLCELFNEGYELLDFIDGKTTIVDSQGKEWSFPEEHRDAKPSSSQIYDFLNGLNNE